MAGASPGSALVGFKSRSLGREGRQCGVQGTRGTPRCEHPTRTQVLLLRWWLGTDPTQLNQVGEGGRALSAPAGFRILCLGLGSGFPHPAWVAVGSARTTLRASLVPGRAGVAEPRAEPCAERLCHLLSVYKLLAAASVLPTPLCSSAPTRGFSRLHPNQAPSPESKRPCSRPGPAASPRGATSRSPAGLSPRAWAKREFRRCKAAEPCLGRRVCPISPPLVVPGVPPEPLYGSAPSPCLADPLLTPARSSPFQVSFKNGQGEHSP